MIPLREIRNKRRGLPDYLNFAALVDDGVVLCKDGTLICGFSYQGIDIKGLSARERNQVSFQINQVIKRLSSGWSLWFEACKQRKFTYSGCERGEFSDPLSRRINEERFELFCSEQSPLKCFQTEYLLFIGFKPPLIRRQRLLERAMFGSSGTELSFDRLVKKFKTEVASIQRDLGSFISIRQLRETEDSSPLLSYLQFCITGVLYPVAIPNCPVYLDSLLGRESVSVSSNLKIGDRYIGVISVDGFPIASSPQMMASIESIMCEFRWNSRFIFLDEHEALSHIAKYRRKWEQKIRGLTSQIFKTKGGVVNLDAINMVQESDEAHSKLQSNRVAYGYYTSTFIISETSRQQLEENVKLISATLKSIGFYPRKETINTMEAWIGSIPGHVVQNIRRPLISTQNVADMIPLTVSFKGLEKNPSNLFPKDSSPIFQAVTTGNLPFRFHLHVSDVGHTFIIGPTGAGKSVLLGLIASQFLRYKGARVYVFDKGYSMSALTDGVGGGHIDFNGEEGVSLCPLGNLQSESDFVFAGEWIELLCTLQGLTVTPEHTQAISVALKQFQNSSVKSLSAFQIALQNEEIKKAIAPYLSGGAVGQLFDSEEDVFSEKSFITFEMEHMISLGEKYVLPLLKFLFRKIEIRFDGNPSIIILDEAWSFLSDSVFAAKIREWLKVLRKANCSLVMASQSLTDFNSSSLNDVIAQECRTKIFLANSSATTPIQAKAYYQLGLTEEDVEIVQAIVPKKEYYIISEHGRAIIDLVLGETALSVLGVRSDRIGRRAA